MGWPTAGTRQVSILAGARLPFAESALNGDRLTSGLLGLVGPDEAGNVASSVAPARRAPNHQDVTRVQLDLSAQCRARVPDAIKGCARDFGE